MWRISRLSLVCLLVLTAFLLPNEVKGQDDAADPTSVPEDAPVDAGGDDAPDAGGDAVDAAGDATPAPDAPADPGADGAPTPAPGDSAPVTQADAGVEPAVDAAAAEEAPAPVVPDVKCVGKEDITESNAVKASVATSDCTATKSIIEAVPANWCSKQACKINIFQDDSTVLVDSEDASLGSLASALQSEEVKNKLGVSDVKYSSSSGSSVLAGILVTGLLAAVALTVGYFKCQRRASPKGERLAEEGSPVDQQNQANTLASDAPLNPPPETEEKPSANGEAPEGDKSPAPPTNGHSPPANTADTEL